jgi:hypothetical protein
VEIRIISLEKKKDNICLDESKCKVTFEVFFLVLYGFIPKGRAVNNVKTLRCLRDVVRRKYPEKWARNSWFLLYSSAFVYLPLARKNLDELDVTALEHPPYFQDFSQPEFIYFRDKKSVVKAHRFASAEEVTAKATRALTEVSKNGSQECF